MKIGMRTLKTAVCATLGILLAQQIGLLYPTAAGIIAILSVTNTKRSAFEVGFYRVCSLALATAIAYVTMSLLGFNAFAFGLYLLLFIPLAVKGKMSDGIPVSSVLVTHYLLEESLSLNLIGNAFLLLFIGVGLAIIANLHMPDFSAELKKHQQKIDDKIRQLLAEMSTYFADGSHRHQCDLALEKVILLLTEAEQAARRHGDNRLLSDDVYFVEFFTMRQLQVSSLKKMNHLISLIDPQYSDTTNVMALFALAGETFSEDNDGLALKAEIEKSLADYRQTELPQSRLEFENRARLYELLSEFDHFIEIKIEFAENAKKTC